MNDKSWILNMTDYTIIDRTSPVRILDSNNKSHDFILLD